MQKYVEVCEKWKYVGIMEKYEEICGRRGSTRSPLNYKLWDLEKFRVSPLFMERCRSTTLVLQARYDQLQKNYESRNCIK